MEKIKTPIELVGKVKSENSEYRKQFEAEWDEFDNAYYGKQHRTGEDRKTVKNQIFKVIEGEVPILTDSMPGTNITAHSEERQEQANILNKSVKYVYNKQNIQLILPTLVRSSLISAPGYLYVYYDADAENGEGEIKYRQLNWKSVYLDGNAQTIEDSESCRIEISMRKEAVARLWPEKREEIMATTTRSFGNYDDSNLEQRDISGKNPGSNGTPKEFSGADIVKYVETWVKDYSLEDIPQDETDEEINEDMQDLMNGSAPDVEKWENHDAHILVEKKAYSQILAELGLPEDADIDDITENIDQMLADNPNAEQIRQKFFIAHLFYNHIKEHEELKKINPTSQKPVYEDGWRLIKSVGNVVLYDGANPRNDGHIPLIPFYCYKDTTIYGFGEVKNIIDAQRTLNDVDFREYEGLRVCSNPGWIADHEAEVDENELTNKPGIVVLKKRGTEVRRLEAGAVSPQLERRKMMDKQFIEDLSGINEATQGNMPTGGASGMAIRQLQTQAIGRVRLKDRYLQHYSMKRLAVVTASFIMKFWTTEKKLRLVTDNSKVDEIVFNPLEMDGLEYSVEIAPGSMAGIDKDALNAFYLQLLGAGHITFEDFLEASDFPKREMLISKIKDRASQQDQAQQQVDQVTEELKRLQKENLKLKAAINPELMDANEKKVFEQLSREEALSQITDNIAPNQGQA